MKSAKTDPHVSCPIVCGEYMRATGFFLNTGDQTYLITARHNILPTHTENLDTGSLPLSYHTENFLPTIDIYLRTNQAFTVKRLHLFKQPHFHYDPEIDVIGVPIPFQPEDYGYVVWTLGDISTENSPATLDIIGYPGQSFPKTIRYCRETYEQSITDPYVLTLRNNFELHTATTTSTDLMSVGIVTKTEETAPDYRGYSGSPVLDDGLAGIHCANFQTTSVIPETGEKRDRQIIAYWQADVLKRLLK